ncbi:MAG: S49 family peptidase [Pirellulaceae bacterium]|nr:S49 family peptidase [Pirellulaceae bacterium]
MSGGTSTVRLRQQLRQARQDPAIVGGMLKMDTPGGTVKGNSDLSDEVARFAAEKPVIAFVEDLTASAGVSVASQATRIIANNGNAMYGAMGTYATLVDTSGMAEQMGVKVHVVRAGEFKGMGEAGTELTEQQLAEAQRIVNRLNEQYLSIIATGRNRSVDSLRQLADGRVIFAADAKAQGLIDDIGSFSEAMDELRGMVKSKTNTSVQIRTNEVIPQSAAGTSSASDKTKETSDMDPATIKELKDKFPKADSSWVLSQLEANASITDAAISYAMNHEFGVSVTLTRGASVTAAFTARRSDKVHEAIGEEFGLKVKVTMRDFWLPVESLVLDGDPVEPRTGDRITEGSEAFAILPPDDNKQAVELQTDGPPPHRNCLSELASSRDRRCFEICENRSLSIILSAWSQRNFFRVMRTVVCLHELTGFL